MSATNLPTLGTTFNGGIYAGITTGKDGAPYALVLLPHKPVGDLSWQEAMDWAKGALVEGDLPTRPEAALLFANVRDHLVKAWHWTNETDEDDASCAWFCYFGSGGQFYLRKSASGAAVAVRRLALESFNPFKDAAKRATAGSAAVRRAALELIAAADKADAALAEAVPA